MFERKYFPVFLSEFALRKKIKKILKILRKRALFCLTIVGISVIIYRRCWYGTATKETRV
jgi:hypothetical protein